MIRNIALLVLLVATALTLGSMVRNMDGIDLATAGFMIWAISPYTLVAIGMLFLSRFASMRSLPAAGLVAGSLMLVVAFFAYWIAMDHTSSTEALVYVVVPLYMHVGGVLILAMGAAVSAFAVRRA